MILGLKRTEILPEGSVVAPLLKTTHEEGQLSEIVCFALDSTSDSLTFPRDEGALDRNVVLAVGWKVQSQQKSIHAGFFV